MSERMSEFLWVNAATFHDAFNSLGFVVLLVFNLLQWKKKEQLYSKPGELRLKALRKKIGKPEIIRKKMKKWNLFELFVLSAVQFLSGAWMNGVVGQIITQESRNYFGFAVFAPLLFIGFCVLMEMDPFGHLDLVTPGYALSLVCFKLGCYCEGCCGGMETSFRFFYFRGFANKFPVQLLEMAVALLIFFFLLRCRGKVPKGTMHPIYLMAYSATRFCTEFLREEENVFLCFKQYHVLCFAGVLIGLGEYLFLSRRTEKIQSRLPEKYR